jgi:hypothetical protein
MSDGYKSPRGNIPIGDTGISHSSMGGRLRQGVECPECGQRLVRNPESPARELREWRVNEDRETTGSE